MWTDRRTDKRKIDSTETDRHTDRETERHGDAISRFLLFCEPARSNTHTHTHKYKYMAIFLEISHIFTIENNCFNEILAP